MLPPIRIDSWDDWTLMDDVGASALTRLGRERGALHPIESIEALQALLCPDSIFQRP